MYLARASKERGGLDGSLRRLRLDGALRMGGYAAIPTGLDTAGTKSMKVSERESVCGKLYFW